VELDDRACGGWCALWETPNPGDESFHSLPRQLYAGNLLAAFAQVDGPEGPMTFVVTPGVSGWVHTGFLKRIT
jgi:hypothetical protein